MKKKILGSEEKIFPTLKSGITKKNDFSQKNLVLYPSQRFKNKKRQVVTQS